MHTPCLDERLPCTVSAHLLDRWHHQLRSAALHRHMLALTRMERPPFTAPQHPKAALIGLHMLQVGGQWQPTHVHATLGLPAGLHTWLGRGCHLALQAAHLHFRKQQGTLHACTCHGGMLDKPFANMSAQHMSSGSDGADVLLLCVNMCTDSSFALLPALLGPRMC